MKFALKIMVSLLSIGLMSLTTSSKYPSKRYFFKTKYDYASVTLYDNGNFTQTMRSCTYSFQCNGNWKANNDTITLNQLKFKKHKGDYLEYAKRSNQLILLNDSTANYIWNIQNGFGESFIMQLDKE